MLIVDVPLSARLSHARKGIRVPMSETGFRKKNGTAEKLLPAIQQSGVTPLMRRIAASGNNRRTASSHYEMQDQRGYRQRQHKMDLPVPGMPADHSQDPHRRKEYRDYQ
jgi:hypothetical protein